MKLELVELVEPKLTRETIAIGGCALNDYQHGALETWTTRDDPEYQIVYPAIGVADEAGEVMGKLKKAFRDHGGKITPEMRTELKKEIGDVLWYLSALSFDLGFTLEEVAIANLEKIRSRKARGVIRGDGDNR